MEAANSPGANSTQGLATLVFLVSFVFLAWSFFDGGNLLFFVLFVIGAAGSVALFLKCKPWEHTHR